MSFASFETVTILGGGLVFSVFLYNLLIKFLSEENFKKYSIVIFAIASLLSLYLINNNNTSIAGKITFIGSFICLLWFIITKLTKSCYKYDYVKDENIFGGSSIRSKDETCLNDNLMSTAIALPVILYAAYTFKSL